MDFPTLIPYYLDNICLDSGWRFAMDAKQTRDRLISIGETDCDYNQIGHRMISSALDAALGGIDNEYAKGSDEISVNVNVVFYLLPGDDRPAANQICYYCRDSNGKPYKVCYTVEPKVSLE